MMVLPFVLFSAAALTGWRRSSALAVLFWVLGIVAMLAMFRYHVTSSLDLDF